MIWWADVIECLNVNQNKKVNQLQSLNALTIEMFSALTVDLFGVTFLIQKVMIRPEIIPFIF